MIDPNSYDYTLPQALLAQKPASPRDSSKLFVYNTQNDTFQIDSFINLDRYLPKNSFLVLNNTKVLPSRITLFKENNARVKVLFLVNELKNNQVRAMVDRKLEMGQRLYFDEKYSLKVTGQDEHIFTFELEFPKEKLITVLEERGSMPIPPYLKHTPLTEKELKRRYQTVFAEEKGSAAAPTASLHFTRRVFNKLERKGIQRTHLKLHVGAGTFAPLLEKNLVEQKLHTEWYEISNKTAHFINLEKKKGNMAVAVGTTVTRTLETAAVSKNRLKASSGDTDIFIFPPYDFKIVDALITNFHVPKSSLMMLVEAFLQYKNSRKSIHQLYSIAIENKLRFFSFGDAMLIL